MSKPTSTYDLRPSEHAFVTAMQRLRFGRFESLGIEHGELVLDPWPTMVRSVKFAGEESAVPRMSPDEFTLKRQVIELFEYVRAVESGEIRCIEVRHGLPFSMEVEHGPGANGGERG